MAVAIVTRDTGEEACGDSDLLLRLLNPASERPNIDDGDLETWQALEAETCQPLPYPRDLGGLHIESILVQRGARDQPPDPALGPLSGYATVAFFDSDEDETVRLRLEVSPYPLDERSYFTSPQEEPFLRSITVKGRPARVTEAYGPLGGVNITWEKDGFYFRAYCNFGEGAPWFDIEDALAILNSIR